MLNISINVGRNFMHIYKRYSNSKDNEVMVYNDVAAAAVTDAAADDDEEEHKEEGITFLQTILSYLPVGMT
jgi:hypothetical protein